MTPRYLRNTGAPWSLADQIELGRLASQDTPTRVIGLMLGRSEEAVRAMAEQLGISLKPVNQSPYNRRVV
jgi:hypothetical protein